MLTFNSAPDFENPADADTDNVYDVQVTVTDSVALTGVQNLLVTVADVNGPWILELQVPDRYVNYVLGARKKLRTDLDVTFMLATDLGVSYSGRLDRFAAASEPNETQQLSATAWVALDRDTLADLRPGAGVTARIYCGRRSIGYVWLHDLIAAVRAKFFL